jgi:transcriptional regulator with XRE-family HTH domain
MTLGRTVRALREGLGLSQHDLADAIEVDRHVVSRIERGHTKRPSSGIISSLAEAPKTIPKDLLAAAGYPTGLPEEPDEIQSFALSKVPPEDRPKVRAAILAVIRAFEDEERRARR